jgi:hypothetical protein
MFLDVVSAAKRLRTVAFGQTPFAKTDEALILKVAKQAILIAAPNARIGQWVRPSSYANRDSAWHRRAQRNGLVLNRAFFRSLYIVEAYRNSDLLRRVVAENRLGLLQNPALTWEILKSCVRSKAPDVCRDLARMILIAQPQSVEAYSLALEGAGDNWPERALARISAGSPANRAPMRRLMAMNMNGDNPVIMSVLSHYLPQLFRALLNRDIAVARSIRRTGWFYVLIGRMLMTGNPGNLAEATDILKWIENDTGYDGSAPQSEGVLRVLADFTAKDIRDKAALSAPYIIFSVPVWGPHVEIYRNHIHDKLFRAIRKFCKASGENVRICFFIHDENTKELQGICDKYLHENIDIEYIIFGDEVKNNNSSTTICVAAFSAGLLLAKLANSHYMPFYAEEVIPEDFFEKIVSVLNNDQPSIFMNTGYSFEADAYRDFDERLDSATASTAFSEFLSSRGKSLEFSFMRRKGVSAFIGGPGKYMDFGRFGLMYYLAPNPMFMNRSMVRNVPIPYPYTWDNRFTDFLCNLGLKPDHIFKPRSMEELAIAGIEVSGENELDFMIATSGDVPSPVRNFRMAMQTNSVTEMPARLGREFAFIGDTSGVSKSTLCVEDAFWKLCMELYLHEVSPFTMLTMTTSTIGLALTVADAALSETSFEERHQ